MSPKLTRRTFLKAGALVAATTVVSGCTVNLQRTEYLESYVKPPEEGLPGESLWYASTCRQCPAGCGIIVRVSNGRARKIEGNPLHPLNAGKLCARGQAALQELYDPDRLKNAVRQVNGRGSAQFEPIYWEDALQTVGNALAKASPGAVAFLGGNLSSHLAWVANRFMNALGSSPVVSYTLGDEVEGTAMLAAASEALFGVPRAPIYDLSRADVVFSFGANFLETWLSPVGYSRAYSRLRRGLLGKRGHIVQFESRCSTTAACADEWIMVNPGSEGLAALALSRIIAEQRGTSEGVSLCERVSVPEMAEACGVPVGDLERLAGIFSAVENPVAIAGGALAGQRNALSAVQAVHALNLLMERFGKPGGVFLPAAMDQEGFDVVAPASYAGVYQLIEDMRAGKVQVLFVHGANPIYDLPLASEFAAALGNVSLVVSLNPVVDETGVQADLILPDHTNLEGWGYHVAPHADRRIVSGQQPVMRPLYDTRATVDVLLALAQQLGGALREALPWQNEVEFLKEMTGKLFGDSVGGSWAIWRQRGGWWSETPEWRQPAAGAAFSQPLVPVLPTFAGEQVDYPLVLYPYLSNGVYDGRGANKSWLQELPDPMTTVTWQTWIELHPETARGIGVKDGDIVNISSTGGTMEALVYVYPGIGEGVAGMPLGRGHTQYGRFAKGNGSNPAQLIVPAQAGGMELAVGATRVRVAAAGRTRALARLEDAEGIEYVRNGREH